MYQPFNPYVYQPYNDPKPDHHASAVPAGMPQPSRPSAFQPPAEQAYAAPGYQGYGAPPSYYPANLSTTTTSHEDQYAPHPSLKQSSTAQYPPAAPSYPPSYPPPQAKPKKEERHSYHSAPQRDEKKNSGGYVPFFQLSFLLM